MKNNITRKIIVMRVLKPGGSLYISDPRFPLIVRWIFNTFFKAAVFFIPLRKTGWILNIPDLRRSV